MRKVFVFILALGAVFLFGDISQATMTILNEFGAARFNGGNLTYTLYTKDEVDAMLATQSTQFNSQIGQINIRLSQVENKFTQDQQHLTTSLQADLEKKVGQILTPILLKQIQQTAADDAANRVLAKLRAQGVCVTC
jgi:hypothetical protein